MNRKRKVGIAETGVGLAMLICLLVVIGYVALHQFGGTSDAPPVEIRPGFAGEPAAGTKSDVPEGDEQPQVLKLESNDAPGHALRTLPDAVLR